ncbi:MAG: hypothetical protein ACXVDD_23425, partial [Polyangia bacterium]
MSQGEASPIEAILGRAEHAADAGAQADLLIEAASLYEATAEYDRAFLVRATAYRLRPSARERTALERLVAFTGRLAELDAMLAETTPALPEEERAEAWLDLGRLRLRRLQSPELALRAL